MQKQPSEGSLKKGAVRNFSKFSRKHLHWDLFLVFSHEFCEICKNTVFAEQHQTTAFNYSSINSSEESTGKQNCKL